MKNWLISISLCAVFCGLISALTPTSWRKYTELAGVLLFIAALLSPLRGISGFDGLALMAEFQEQAKSEIDSQLTADIRASVLANYINSKLEVRGINCTVSLNFSYSDSDFLCTHATAVFQGAVSDEDIASALKLISQNTGIAVEEIKFSLEGGDLYQS